MPRLADLLSDLSDKSRLDAIAKQARSSAPKAAAQKKARTPSPIPRASMPIAAELPRMSIPDFVALDLETTGLNAKNDRITEIGAVRYSNGIETASWSSLINPGIPIPLEITRLTGITDDTVAQAPPFESIVDTLLEFLGALPACGHQVDFDISFLNESLTRLGKATLANPQLDTAALSRVALMNLPGYALGSVAAHLGVTLTNAHRALDDARASGEVAVRLIPALLEIPRQTRRVMAGFAPRSMIKKLILDSLSVKSPHDQTPPPPPQRSGLRPETYTSDMHLDSTEALELLRSPQGLAAYIEHFVPRPQQLTMAAGVAKALNAGSILVAEAGTGTGKSLAYLIPAAMFALQNNTRILVSTHTRNLQDQLATKDLPVVSAAIGGGLRYSVLKGRGNYLCRRRYELMLGGGLTHLSARERMGLLPLLRWAEQTISGDIEEQRQFNRNWHQRIWNQISADSQGCRGFACPSYGECFVQLARRRAQNSHIVIVNHSLFFSDICAETSFLNHNGPVIFDEAHHLQATGHRCLRVVVDTNRLNHFCESVGSIQARLEKAFTQSEFAPVQQLLKKRLRYLRSSTQAFCTDLAIWARSAGLTTTEYQSALKEKPFETMGSLAGLHLELDSLASALHDFSQKLTGDSNDEDAASAASDVDGLTTQLLQLRADLRYVSGADTQDHVFWLEGSFAKGWVKLSGVPLDIGAVLRPFWQRQNAAMVFTSATLSVAGSIDFFAAQIGIDKELTERRDTLMLPTPFGPHQSIRLALRDAPSPNEPGFGLFCAQSVTRLSVATSRSILVLFTSNALLEEVYHLLEHEPLLAGTRLFAQGIAGGRATVLEEFKKCPGSILLGTSSFWEGIDVPGQTCELVIIPRLPFTVPTEPLAQALAESARQQNGESFFSYSVPEAVIRFRQGAGRLIRTIHDRGALVILDNRIVTKGYGKAFVRSLEGGVEQVESMQALETKICSFFDSPPEETPVESVTYVPLDDL